MADSTAGKLMVSVDGGEPKPVTSVVLFLGDVPVAGAIQRHLSVFYADSSRDNKDLQDILKMLNVKPKPVVNVGTL